MSNSCAMAIAVVNTPPPHITHGFKDDVACAAASLLRSGQFEEIRIIGSRDELAVYGSRQPQIGSGR